VTAPEAERTMHFMNSLLALLKDLREELDNDGWKIEYTDGRWPLSQIRYVYKSTTEKVPS
jgi:hypothetical protein